MTPFWKVKREVRRFYRQGVARLDGGLGVIRRFRYDKARPHNLQMTQGALLPGPHLAIFLIYQPRGIAASIITALEALHAAGAVPLVISNTALSGPDRTRLAAQSWRVVERPNIGYDFGGYREGLAQIREAQLTLNTLWILNDSGWFPSGGVTTPLAALVEPDAALSGTMIRMHKRNPARVFIESYFLTFTQAALSYPGFLRFWQHYPLFRNKYAVVYNGEFKLSSGLRAGGLRIDSKMSNAKFLTALQDQSPAFLRKTLHYGGLTLPDLAQQRATLLQDPVPDLVADPHWPKAALAHIAAALDHSEFYYQFPFAAVHLLGFPFIKKGPDPRYRVWRRQYLAAVNAGDLPALPEPIADELAAAVAADALTGRVDWRFPAG